VRRERLQRVAQARKNGASRSTLQSRKASGSTLEMTMRFSSA
jgi:hypothetical protein